jgi:hypothetical protein
MCPNGILRSTVMTTFPACLTNVRHCILQTEYTDCLPKTKKLNSVASVRKRTIPTERRPYYKTSVSLSSSTLVAHGTVTISKVKPWDWLLRQTHYIPIARISWALGSYYEEALCYSNTTNQILKCSELNRNVTFLSLLIAISHSFQPH